MTARQKEFPMSKKLKFETYDCPGKWKEHGKLKALHTELKNLAKRCLDEIPNYQCLRDDLRDMDRLIIVIARNRDGRAIGFTSSYLLQMQEETILHLGLTCVCPTARGLKLTHKLSSKVVQTFLWNYSLTKSSWVSNVACVLSSLGNVANYFDQVYPSPFVKRPSKMHQEIAQYIDQNYRSELFIRPEATFNAENFVFEESVLGNMFQKENGDKRYHHRNNMLNQYFRNLINFERGDEVLQLAKVSWMTFPKYALKKMIRKIRKSNAASSAILVGQ
jgi:hypothetical protein